MLVYDVILLLVRVLPTKLSQFPAERYKFGKLHLLLDVETLDFIALQVSFIYPLGLIR